MQRLFPRSAHDMHREGEAPTEPLSRCALLRRSSTGASPVGIPIHWLVIVIAIAMTAVGCGRASKPHPQAPLAPSPVNSTSNSGSNLLPHIDLPQPSQRLGTAVVILIDTSGSMEQRVNDHAGHQQPKYQIAREALQKIIGFTDAWQSNHKETPFYLGISSFSSDVSEVLKMSLFDSAKASQAVQKIPHPAGGTAIGKALSAGFVDLYSTGCVRKHLVCITDGNNTVGTPPDLMARQLYSQTHGDVEMHFVAFDTTGKHFEFLKTTGGSVLEAADGNQLQAQLTEIYEKRIFAEAMPAEKQ